MALSGFGQVYKDNLQDLTTPERRSIVTLKDLAFENPEEVASVVEAIRQHIKQVGTLFERSRRTRPDVPCSCLCSGFTGHWPPYDVLLMELSLCFNRSAQQLIASLLSSSWTACSRLTAQRYTCST